MGWRLRPIRNLVLSITDLNLKKEGIGMKKFEMVKLAVKAGIKDNGYKTVANGWVNNYKGEVELEIEGVKYLAKGHKPDGDAYSIFKDGYIEFIEI